MKAGLPDNPEHDAPLDDTDPIWRLLGHSPRPEPDAWFAVRTLARCRHTRLGSEWRGMTLGRIWRWALGGGLGLCLAMFFMVKLPQSDSGVSDGQKNVQEAFAIMASLGSDSDTSSSSSSSWQDSSL